MGVFTLDPTRVRDLSHQLLAARGRLRVVPVRELENTTPEERLLLGVRHGPYGLPTQELVDFPRTRIAGRIAKAMSKPSWARYRTTNWPACNASLERRGLWLDPKLQWQAAPSGRAGRPAVFSDAAIRFCLTLKCMVGLGLRQATGLAERLPKPAQLDWNVTDCSTLSRQMPGPWIQGMSPDCCLF